jgi:hypothetical protein
MKCKVDDDESVADDCFGNNFDSDYDDCDCGRVVSVAAAAVVDNKIFDFLELYLNKLLFVVVLVNGYSQLDFVDEMYFHFHL